MLDQLGLYIKQSDERAFELFFRMYHARLCSFANKFLNNPEDAKEIVQDAFTKIWEGRSEIDPNDCLRSYIFKITQNLCLNRLKREKVESKYIELYKMVYTEQQEFSVHDSLLNKELEEHINLAFLKLPCECRKVFELSRIGGHKYKEIADICQISIKTVEAQMSKALRILRVALSEHLTLFLIFSVWNSFY